MAKSNKLLKDFGSTLDRRFSKAYSEQSMIQWICANTTMAGLPFSTKGYEFQDAIANDMHPNMDVKKCSQIGLSEIQIRKALAFVSRNRGVAAIFTMPSENMFRRMAQTRILPIVNRDKIFNLQQDENSTRSMSILQFDTSFLYVTGCTEDDATSTAADAVFNDEVDLSDEKMLALFNSRLQNSDYRISQRFSTPTFQEFGIDAGYKASDQRKYLHHCASCGHWNWPEFNRKFCIFPDLPAHIEDLMELVEEDVNAMDLSKCFVACEKCQSPLSTRAKREWIATFPGRTNARGYWVSPFSTLRITLPYIAQQLIKYKKQDHLRGFHNTVLGQTYSDAQTQIPLECIERAMTRGTPNIVPLPDRPLALGCDMGQTCHLVVGDAYRNDIYLMEQVPSERIVERIATLRKQHNIIAGCVDRLPYTPTANQISIDSKRAIVPMQYAITKDSDMKLILDQYEILSHVHMNRTKILDKVSAAFREYNISLSGYGHQREVVVTHFRDMVRKEEPEKLAIWEKLTGQDHYFHATALYMASMILRPLILEHLNGGVGDQFGFGTATMGETPAGLPGGGSGNSFDPRSVTIQRNL